MTQIQGWIAIAVLILIALEIMISTVASRIVPESPRWEYKLVNPDDLMFEHTIDSMGKDGWELVFARRATNTAGRAEYEAIFKRRR